MRIFSSALLRTFSAILYGFTFGSLEKRILANSGTYREMEVSGTRENFYVNSTPGSINFVINKVIFSADALSGCGVFLICFNRYLTIFFENQISW